VSLSDKLTADCVTKQKSNPKAEHASGSYVRWVMRKGQKPGRRDNCCGDRKYSAKPW
jgi:hypothetical protein